ncbi:YncE family protein [Salipaludibacillus aurantiacus]|nr:hypothetical protein [Salipaludibacillus aurantiacus]
MPKMPLLLTLVIFLIMNSGCTGEGHKLNLPDTKDNLLLVSHLKNPLLTVIDLNEQEIIRELELPFIVSDMVKINENEIIISSQQTDSLYSLRLDDHILEPFVETGKGINELIFIEKTGTVYAANSLKNELVKVSIQDDIIVNKKNTEEHPSSLTYNPDRDEIYLANVYDHSIQRFDGDSLELIDTLTIVDRPNGLLYYDQHLIAGGHGATEELNRDVFIFSLSEKETVHQLTTGLMPIDFVKTDDSERLYAISHGSHEVYEIDPETFSVLRKIEVGFNPYSSLYHSGTLFISTLDGHTVTLIETEDFQIYKEIAVAPGPHTMILLEGIK